MIDEQTDGGSEDDHMALYSHEEWEGGDYPVDSVDPIC